jgi:putative transposase
LIDYEGLRKLLNFRGMNDLADAYRSWVEESLSENGQHRDRRWAESIAVGSEGFVTATKEKLGVNLRM